MSYSISFLLTTEDCDNMLAIAQKERDDAAFRKTSVERRQSATSSRSVEVSTELQTVNTELATWNALIGTLADGPVKSNLEDRVIRLEYRKFLLEGRSESYGTIALIEQELELALLNQSITEIDAFIAQVSAHRATL